MGAFFTGVAAVLVVLFAAAAGFFTGAALVADGVAVVGFFAVD